MAVTGPRLTPTPYGGLWTDPDTGETSAPPTGSHMLVSAPTGGGKTESLLAPAVISWPGPRVVASSKDDALRLCSERLRGPIYLIDLRQIPSPFYGTDVIRCRIDPTTLIDRHDDALNMAGWLHRVANLSLGGRITSHSEPYWAAQIIPALAAILYAASPRGNGLGIDWALHAVENPFKPEPKPEPAHPEGLDEEQLELRIAEQRCAELAGDDKASDSAKTAAELAVIRARKKLKAAEAIQAAALKDYALYESAERSREQRIAAGEDPLDVYADDPPSWWDVRQYIPKGSLLAAKIERTATLSARQRDSVALGMSGALFPWLYLSVRQSNLPIFDPVMLKDPQAALFILAEPEGGGVGAALPLVQSIVAAWRRESSMGTIEHNLLLAIDELTNTLPLPTLDILVSEARGLGINLMAFVQSSKQLAHRYDPIFMETLLGIFPVVLALYGSTEVDILDQASLWSGITNRATETLNQVNGDRVIAHNEGPLFLPQELQPLQRFRGRLIYRGTEGVEVVLPSFAQFLHMFDHGTVRGMVRF